MYDPPPPICSLARAETFKSEPPPGISPAPTRPNAPPADPGLDRPNANCNMVSTVYAIARNTFTESVRQPVYFIIVGLAALFHVFSTWSAAFSMGMTESGEVSGDDKLLLDLNLATVFVGGMLLAAFLATAVISREIEQKTVLTVVSKPVSRPAVVLGKYLGVTAAIVVAVVTMLVFVQLSIRHGVMQTTADKLDGPVLVFSGLAVAIAVIAGVWCNFFYGWVFSQTTTLLLCPLIIVAWVLVLGLGKDWHFQSLLTTFKPQIAMASVAILLSQLVMTAVATAASARLGQVMTIVVCCGVFLMGLLSNHFLGRRAVENDAVSRVRLASPLLPSRPDLQRNGDGFNVTLEFDPRRRLEPGTPFYFGPNPSGFMLATTHFRPFDGSIAESSDLTDRSRPPAIVITRVDGRDLTLLRVGADTPVSSRPPRPGDWIFIKPTVYHPVFLTAWLAVPNIQFFWLTDAVTQNQPIPLSHIALLSVYAVSLVGVFLSLAVVLFQKREVG